MTKGLFTWKEEDPRRRNNFSFGLHTEISVGEVTMPGGKGKKKRIRKIVGL